MKPEARQSQTIRPCPFFIKTLSEVCGQESSNHYSSSHSKYEMIKNTDFFISGRTSAWREREEGGQGCLKIAKEH